MSSYYEKILATGEVKCIDDEVPFEIPQGWEWCRMQDVITFVNGRAYKKEELLSRGKYKVLRVGNFFTNNQWYYSDLELPEDKYCYHGDLLYAWSASFGPQIWNGDKTIFHYHIWNVKFDTKVLFREYLYYFFLFDKTQVRASTTGSTMVHVSMENMKPRLIPIPPIDEQKRIVCGVERVLPYVEKYELSQSRKDILDANIKESLKKSILQEAIQGKLVPQIAGEGTAHELLEQIKAEKLNLVKKGKLKKTALNDSVIFRGDDNKYYEQVGKSVADISEQIPFDIPETWSWSRGKSIFLPMESEKPKNDFVYIDVDAVNNIKYIIDNPKHITTENAPSRASRKLHENDVLFSMVRPYLKNIALVTNEYKNAIASTGFYVITPCIGIYPQYLYWMMLSSYIVDGLNMFMKGDNSPSINNCHIEEYLYPIPPESEQQRVVVQIETLFEQLH